MSGISLKSPPSRPSAVAMPSNHLKRNATVWTIAVVRSHQKRAASRSSDGPGGSRRRIRRGLQFNPDQSADRVDVVCATAAAFIVVETEMPAYRFGTDHPGLGGFHRFRNLYRFAHTEKHRLPRPATCALICVSPQSTSIRFIRQAKFTYIGSRIIFGHLHWHGFKSTAYGMIKALLGRSIFGENRPHHSLGIVTASGRTGLEPRTHVGFAGAPPPVATLANYWVNVMDMQP